MTALTQGRNTPQRNGDDFAFLVAAGVKIYAGGMVALNAAGFAVPGSTSTTLKVAGRADAEADNSGGADGDIRVRVRRGAFQWENSAAADEITAVEVGTDCYLVDDQTVAKTDGGGTRSIAGRILDVDAQGVWVRMGL